MQTIYLEKEKKQSKFKEVGKCAYCGQELDHKGYGYCNEVCEEAGRKIGGDCEICGLLTQEGELYCSPECALEADLLGKLDGWFPDADRNRGLLIMWEDNETLVIDLYDTANRDTASKYSEMLLLLSRKFKYQR